MSILPQTLVTFDYYLSKLPMLLRQDTAFVEHFKIWFDMMMSDRNDAGIVPTANMMLQLLNIFDDNYLSTINSLEDAADGTKSDILDKLASLFGVSRSLSVNYVDKDGVFHKDEQLTLNNNDLLMFIKMQIVNDYCDGTAEQMIKFYELAGLHVFVITTTLNATAHLYLADNIEGIVYSDNIRKLFAAGLLRISSLGISYDDDVRILRGYLEWDMTAGRKQGWGRGVWAP